MSSKPGKHLLISIGPGWGHVIALTQTALTLLRHSPSLKVTLLTFSDTIDKLAQEIAKQKHLDSSYLDRIQYLAVKPIDESPCSGYAETLASLMGSNEVENVENKFDTKIDCIIFDTLAVHTPEIVRGVVKKYNVEYVPCVYIGPVLTAGCLRLSGKEEYGGRLSTFQELYDRYQQEGDSAIDAGRKAYVRMEGKLLETKDLPPLYDHELQPGVFGRPFPERIAPRAITVYKAGSDNDGYISFGVPEMELISTDLMKQSLAPRELYPIGFQLDHKAFHDNAPSVRTEYKPEERRIMDFLDKMKTKFGERSTVFFSLGSQWWPDNRPELINYLIESFLEAEPPLPFLISAVAKQGSVSPELRKKIEESGIGLMVDWVPQLTVLQHDAVRFFVTHCGSGSTVEAIMAGMPIVAWPFTADQPIWATLLCRTFRVGVQLHQVNSGMKGKPLATGGIVHETKEAIKGEMENAWKIMRSGEYHQMKTRMEDLRQMALDSRDHGEAKQGVEAVIVKYLS